MRETIKRYWYFTKDDKKAFVEWIKEKKLTATAFAYFLQISDSLLSEILNGKKPLTERLKVLFNENGYKI